MKLLLDDDGHVVTKEVNGVLMPVYADGKKEEPFDAQAAVSKIKEQAEDLSDVEKTSSKETAEFKKQLRAWERLGDIKDVRSAVSTVKSLKDEDLDAAELPNKLSEAIAERDALQDQVEDLTEQVGDLKEKNYRTGVGHQIAAAMPNLSLLDGMTADDLEALVDKWAEIKEEDDKWVVRTRKDGKPVMVVDDGNKPRMASIPEALDQIIPQTFRKPSGARGSDAKTDESGSRIPAGNIRTKADLKTPDAKAKYIADHGLEAFQNLPRAKQEAATA